MTEVYRRSWLSILYENDKMNLLILVIGNVFILFAEQRDVGRARVFVHSDTKIPTDWGWEGSQEVSWEVQKWGKLVFHMEMEEKSWTNDDFPSLPGWMTCSAIFWQRSPKMFNFHASNKVLLVAQTVKRLSTMWETQVRSLGREDPLEKKMAIYSSILAWKIP